MHGRRRPPAAEHVSEMLDAPLLVVVPGGLWLNGVRLESDAELGRMLRNMRTLARSRAAISLLLEADRTLSMAEIAPRARAAEQSGYRVSFVVRRLSPSRGSPR